MLSLLALNVRYAARQLAAHPGFSLFAAFSLAIGIAASITLFSAADALLFAPLRARLISPKYSPIAING